MGKSNCDQQPLGTYRYLHGGPRMVPDRRVACVLAALVGLLAAGTLAACSVSLPPLASCGVGPEGTLSAIEGRLNTAGTLRNGFTGPSPLGHIVSAELHSKGKKVGAKGDILSWIEVAPGNFVSVDAHARHLSGWPAARVGVGFSKVINTRGCVESVRGTMPCNSGSGAAAIGVGGGRRTKGSCPGGGS